MRGKPWAFVAFALLVMGSILFAALALQMLEALIVIVSVLLFVTFTATVWAPDWYPKWRLGTYAIAMLVVLHFPILAWSELPYDLIRLALGLLGMPPAEVAKFGGNSTSMVPLVALALFDIAVLGVLWLVARPTILPNSPEPEELRAPEYQQQLTNMAARLERQLNDIDIDTSWSDDLFAPLDAEVEVRSRRLSRRRVESLVAAIKGDRATKLFLILGDPGAGKSVALRRLTRMMLLETRRTGVLPVYVNLKEWSSFVSAPEATTDNVQRLYELVKEIVRRNGDLVVEEFIDAYFDRMFRAGKLFFVFDSFDEIPALLDKDESSETIDEISTSVKGLLLGANPCRGIVASRLYRRPRISSEECKLLEVRPFTERQIRDSMIRHPRMSLSWIDRLFLNEPWMVSLARNPLVARLIAEYLIASNGNLPDALTNCFESFIAGRLERADARLRRSQLTASKVLETAAKIAAEMFSRAGVGLEIPKAHLAELLPNLPVDAVVDVLQYCRVVRIGPGPLFQVSFVHRRFNEYFLVKHWQANVPRVDLSAIPEDRRERDALVLYAEVAGPLERARIIDYCLVLIRALADDYKGESTVPMGAVRALRFCADAFTRRGGDLPPDFRSEVGKLLTEKVQNSRDDLIFAKICLEAVAIIPQENALKVLNITVASGNSWLIETAARGCRYVSGLPFETLGRLQQYVLWIPFVEMMRRSGDLRQLMLLAESLKPIWQLVVARTIDLYAALVLTPVMVALVGIWDSLVLLFAVAILTVGRELLRSSSGNFAGRHRFLSAIRNFEPFYFIRLGLCAAALMYLAVPEWQEFFKDEFASASREGTRTIGIPIIADASKLFDGPSGRFQRSSIFSTKEWETRAGLYLLLLLYLPFSWKWHVVQWVLNREARSYILRRWVKRVGRVISALLGFSFTLALFYGVSLLVGRWVVIYAMLLLGFSGVLAVIGYAGRYWLRYARDSRKIDQMRFPATIYRDWLWREFASLHTDKGRSKFVTILEAALLESGKVPQGGWPEGILPIFGVWREPGTRLAQLEAKWLQVDR